MEAISKPDHIARFQAFAGPGQRTPDIVIDALNQVHITGDVCPRCIAGRPNALERGWQHARIIEYEHVAGQKIARQVPDRGVFEPSVAMHDQQTG